MTRLSDEKGLHQHRQRELDSRFEQVGRAARQAQPGPGALVAAVRRAGSLTNIWEYELMDLYRYLWVYVDIYMEFGYLF